MTSCSFTNSRATPFKLYRDFPLLLSSCYSFLLQSDIPDKRAFKFCEWSDKERERFVVGTPFEGTQHKIQGFKLHFPNIKRMIKPMRMRWAGYVTLIIVKQKLHSVLKPKCRQVKTRLSQRMTHKDSRMVWNRFTLLTIMSVACSCQQDNAHLWATQDLMNFLTKWQNC
jgi:hypothetical protein